MSSGPQLKDPDTQALTVPGHFQPCYKHKGRIEGVYPSSLLIGVYRRPSDNSPCRLFMRCWPDGKFELNEVHSDPVARLLLSAREGATP